MMYEKLADLTAAVRSGEVTEPAMIDNDQVTVYQGGEKVFDMHPAELLEQALDMLSVPHEPV